MKARENPFAVDRVLKVRYRFQVNGWAEFLDRLAASRCRGAIVGPEGSGKTTLLEDLRPRLTQRGYQTVWIRLARGERTSLRSLLRLVSAQDTHRHVILFDGAEQLGPLRWRLFERNTRQAAGLVITTHRPGRMPTLIECSTNAGLLKDMVAQLLGDAGISADRLDDTIAKLDELFAKHRGNLRDALRELYDDCATKRYSLGANCCGVNF